MSIATDIIDFWADELTSAVDGLENVVVHKYTSRSIESFLIDGQRHLAVWHQDAGQQQKPAPFGPGGAYATGEMNIEYNFVLLYWEPSADAENVKADEDAAARLLQLAEDIRARFLSQSNRTMSLTAAAVWKTDWTESRVEAGGNQGPVQFIAATFVCNVAVDYTA